MDHTCEQQGIDEERGVPPPELPKRQRVRKGETEKKKEKSGATKAHCI